MPVSRYMLLIVVGGYRWATAEIYTCKDRKFSHCITVRPYFGKTMKSVNEDVQSTDLDTAISMTKVGKFHVALVLVSSACLAATTADSLGLSFSLPAMACDLGLTASEKGLVSGASFLGMILTTHAWGFASDTFGRRGALITSAAIGWLMSFLASLAPIFWLLVVLRFFAGAAYAGISSTMYAFLVEFFAPKTRGKAVSWMYVVEASIFNCMPVVAWFTLTLTWRLDLGFVVLQTWRFTCLINGLWALITAVALVWFPESPKFLVSMGKNEEAIAVLRRVYSINTGRPQSEYQVREIKRTLEDVRTVQIDATKTFSPLTLFKGMKDQLIPIFGREHLRASILGCLLHFCVYSTSNGLFLWLPDILNRMFVTTPNTTDSTFCDVLNFKSETSAECKHGVDYMVYVGTLILGVSFCLGYGVVGILTSFMGKRTTFGALQVLSGLAGFAMYWTNSTHATILFFVYILLPSLAEIPLSAAVIELYPTHLRSAAMCIALSVGKLGAAMTADVIGSLFEYNCTVAIFGLGALSFVSGLLSVLIPKHTKEVILVE